MDVIGNEPTPQTEPLKGGYYIGVLGIYRVHCPHCGDLTAIDLTRQASYDRAVKHAMDIHHEDWRYPQLEAF